MYQVSNDYKDMMNSSIRNRAYISVSLGVVNSDAQGDVEVDEDVTPLTSYSDEDAIYDFSGEPVYYATCEQDYFKADGTMYYLPEGDYTNLDNTGIASEDVLSAITFKFGDAYAIKGLTIDFGDYYPTEFTITSDTASYTYTNSDSEFSTTDSFGDTETLTITPTSMVGGYQRLHIFKIIMGVGLAFSDESVSSCTQIEKISFISGELPQNDLSITILDPNEKFDVDSTDSFINYLSAGQNLTYSVGQELEDGTVEWIPMANTLLTDWKVDGLNVTFVGADRLSFMDSVYTAGNTIHSRTLYSDVYDLLTYMGYESDEFIIDDCLNDVTITAPLSESPVNQLLQMICNAGRCIIYQNREGIIVVKANFQIVLDPDDVTVSTVGATDYSNAANVLVGATTVYANCTADFFSADGSMKYLPEDSSDYVTTTGFISEEVADSDGLFSTNPSITMDMPGTVSYYGLNMVFDGNPPQALTVTTYSSGTLVDEFTYDEIETENYFADTYANFDSMTIEFTLGTPNNRVLVNTISFGDASDYELIYDNIYGEVTGVREKNVKEVRVKIYSYEEDSDGNPQVVEDSVYYTQTLNSVGETVTVTNPLIDSESLAQDVAEWIGNYYSNNVSYSCEFRGEPRLNASDIIYLESNVLNNLQVEIEKHTFKYNGAFRGNLEMRRALRLTE